MFRNTDFRHLDYLFLSLVGCGDGAVNKKIGITKQLYFHGLAVVSATSLSKPISALPRENTTLYLRISGLSAAIWWVERLVVEC